MRNLATTSQFSHGEIAESADTLAQAGFMKVNDVVAASKSSMDLATVGQLGLVDATMISVDAMSSFGLMTKDTEKNISNLVRVNNALSLASDASTVSVSDLYESMKYAGSIIRASEDPKAIETFSGLAAVIGLAGVKADMAGTAIQQMFLRLASPPAEALTWLKTNKIALEDANGNMLDQLEILSQIAKKTKKMGSRKVMNVAEVLFGDRAVRGAIPVLKLGPEAILKIREDMSEGGKAAAAKAEEMRNSLQNKLKNLENLKIELGFKFIDKIKDKLPGIIDAIGDIINKIDVDKIQLMYWNIKTTIVEIKDRLIEMKPYLMAVGMAFAVTKVIIFGEAIIALTAKMRLLVVAIGPFYAMVMSLTYLVVTMEGKWGEFGDSLIYMFGRIGSAIEKLFRQSVVGAVKTINSILRGSWLENLLKKIGVLGEDSLNSLDRKVDALFANKEYSVGIKPYILSMPELPSGEKVSTTTPGMVKDRGYAAVADAGYNAITARQSYDEKAIASPSGAA